MLATNAIRASCSAAVVVVQAAENSDGSERAIDLGCSRVRLLLEQAGFQPFVLDKAERQWRHLGRNRAGSLYRMLLDADLALKGRSSQPAKARLVLEQFIAKLSTAGDPRKN